MIEMGMAPNWTEHELLRLKALIRAGKTNVEIAKILGRPKSGVQIKSYRYYGGNPNYMRLKTKHTHLRRPVLTYFLNHTWDETRDRFGLTNSELKSVFSAGYKMRQFKHLRKETRDHSAWSKAQLVFLLKHAGLRPRKWVAEQIGRGNQVCIKERLQALGLSSRTLQGITLSQFRLAFGRDPDFYLQTDAGPDGGLKTAMPTRWKIIPWVWLDQEIKLGRLKTAKEMRLLISSRAMFQEWIFEGNALKKMKRIVREIA